MTAWKFSQKAQRVRISRLIDAGIFGPLNSLSAASLFVRIVLAIVFTGVISAVVYAALMAGALTLASPELQNNAMSGLLLAGLAALYGAFISIPMAVIGGIMVEWPKAFWLSQREGGGWLHCLISVVSAVILFALVFKMLTASIPGFWGDGPDSREQWAFIAGLFSAPVSGGLISAGLWWWMVVVPWRRSRAA